MTDTDLQQLFSPIRIAGLEVPNRFAMAPMTRQASPEGVPGPDVADYYARRAAGGVGLIITEGVRLADPAAGAPATVPTLDGPQTQAAWRQVTDAVHAEGATIAAQLWHQGLGRPDSDGVVPVSPSGHDGTGQAVGRALSADDLPKVSASFADAARAARAAGFDAVELHGAHGYLLDQFLWAPTNTRDDGYGGSLAARVRFPAEVVAEVRAAVGPDFPIVFRFSQWKSSDYAARIADTPDELGDILGPLTDAGVDAFHPSARRFYRAGFPDAHPTRSLASWTRQLTGRPVIAVGSVGLDTEFDPRDRRGGPIGTPQPHDVVSALLGGLADGDFDLVALGRALLADASWVNRLRDGELGGFAGYDARKALAGLN